MTAFDQKLYEYADYHRDLRTKATHFLGVPIVVYALFVPMAWFRFVNPDIPLTGATIFYVCVMVHYARLDWMIMLLQAPVTLTLYWLADLTALLPFGESFALFAAALIIGSVIQGIGHYFEGRRPALFDDFTQIFNAPLFLVCEVLFGLGLRKEQYRRLEARLGPRPQ